MTEPPSWSAPSGGEPSPVPPPPPPPPQYGAPGYGGAGYPPPYGGYQGYQQPFAVAAPKPGIIPLRPLAVGEILDGAFAAIRRHPKAILGLSAAVACVQQALSLLVRWSSGSLSQSSNIHLGSGSSSSGSQLGTVYGSLFGTLAISTFVGALLTGALCLMVSDSVLGQPTSVRSAWTRLRPMAVRLVVVSVLATVGELLALVFCIAPGVFLWTMWALVVPALVLERTTVGGAFRRSWRLVKSSFWRVLGIAALGVLIANVLKSIVGAIAGASALHDVFSHDLFTSSGTSTVVHISAFTIVLGAVLGVLATTLTAPFLAGVVTLLYVDRRIRAEALDVQLQRAAAAPVGVYGASTTFG